MALRQSNNIIPKKSFPCNLCEKSYGQPQTLTRHKQTAHGGTNGIRKLEKFKCDVCGQLYQRPDGLARHSRKHAHVLAKKFYNSEGSQGTLDSSPSHSDSSAADIFSNISGTIGNTTGSSTPVTDDGVARQPSDQNGPAGEPCSSSRQPAPSMQHEETFFQDQAATWLDGMIHNLRPAAVEEGFPGRQAPVQTPLPPKRLTEAREVLNSIKWEEYPVEICAIAVQFEKFRIALSIHQELNNLKKFAEYWSEIILALDDGEYLDLEQVLREVERKRRYTRLRDSFRATHAKFSGNDLTPDKSGSTDLDRNYKMEVRRAWRVATRAGSDLLSGVLPKSATEVLAIAELSDAMRIAMDHTNLDWKDRFSADLGRWMVLVPEYSHAAFSHYANVLWDQRPMLDNAWKEVPSMEQLQYFQDLLVEILVPTSSPPPDVKTQGFNQGSTTQPIQTGFYGSRLGVETASMVDVASDREPGDALRNQFTLIATGAIFAFIVAFLLLCQGIVSIEFVVLAMLDLKDRPAQCSKEWAQQATLRANCILVGILLGYDCAGQQSSDPREWWPTVSAASSFDGQGW